MRKFVIGFSLFLAAGIALFAWPRGTVTVCNGTPYKIQYATAHNASDGYRLIGYRLLQAGECQTSDVLFSELIDPEFYVHAKGRVQDNYYGTSKTQNYLLRTDEDVSTYWNVPALDVAGYGEISFDQGGGNSYEFISCVDFMGSFHPRDENKEYKNVGRDGLTFGERIASSCSGSALAGGFFLAGRNPEPFDGYVSSNIINENHHWALPIINVFRRDWVHTFEHPGWSFGEIDPRNPHARVSGIQERARATHSSLSRQFRAETYFSNREPIALFSAKLEDLNSSLNPGVTALNVASTDIFQVPQTLREGDLIMAVNGSPVFSVSEALYNLQLHANSLQKGIDVPVELLIQNQSYCRNGCVKRSRYFFNARTLREVSDLEAGYYGFTDMVFFGGGSSATCGGKKAAVVAGNLIAGAFDLVNSKINKRDFDKRSLNTFEGEEFEVCRWKGIQRKAFTKQTRLDYYDKAGYLGFITPGGVRLLFTKSARRGTSKVVGKGMASRTLADAGLEAAESMLWAMGTAAPGTAMSDRMKNAAKVAPIGAGLGFAVGVVGEGLKLGRKK